MRVKRLAQRTLIVLVGFVLAASATDLLAAQRTKPDGLSRPDNRDARRLDLLKEEVGHQLVMLPYYSVFDWLQAQAGLDGTVRLMGQVVRPVLKDDAEAAVKKIESVTRVNNNIEVLPVSTFDDDLRVALYRKIYNYGSPLFRYALQSIPPIHIVVRNGHVALKGVVANQADSNYAGIAARQVPGIFELTNELQIEQPQK